MDEIITKYSDMYSELEEMHSSFLLTDQIEQVNKISEYIGELSSLSKIERNDILRYAVKFAEKKRVETEALDSGCEDLLFNFISKPPTESTIIKAAINPTGFNKLADGMTKHELRVAYNDWWLLHKRKHQLIMKFFMNEHNGIIEAVEDEAKKLPFKPHIDHVYEKYGEFRFPSDTIKRKVPEAFKMICNYLNEKGFSITDYTKTDEPYHFNKNYNDWLSDKNKK